MKTVPRYDLNAANQERRRRRRVGSVEAATESSGHNPSNAGEDGLFEFARGLPGKTRLPPQAYAEKRKGGSTENFKGTVFHLPEKRETTLIRNREKARIVFLRQPTIHSVEQEMF